MKKRHAIEQIEARLKVGIIILPSKHLETPAYDIERIKEKEAIEEKPSYLQIKAEDITIPEFAQQIKPKVEKAAIKEFMHTSPAPVQTKTEAASLIKRFWHKLVGPSAEPEVIVTPAPVVEKVRPADESKQGRSRRRGGRNQVKKTWSHVLIASHQSKKLSRSKTKNLDLIAISGAGAERKA